MHLKSGKGRGNQSVSFPKKENGKHINAMKVQVLDLHLNGTLAGILAIWITWIPAPQSFLPVEKAMPIFGILLNDYGQLFPLLFLSGCFCRFL